MNHRFALPFAMLAVVVAAACSGLHVSLGDGASGMGGNSGQALGGASAEVGGSSLMVDPDPNTVCAAGAKTTVSGIVYDPAGQSPLYNAVVYVPRTSGELPALRVGVDCEKCTDPVPARAIALSGPDGSFLLEDVPAGT